jgi:Flp pilus assembly protein TadG
MSIMVEGRGAMVSAGQLAKAKNRIAERGQSLVETAIVLMLLMLLTFAIIDFSSLFYVFLALENGVSQATRYAVTGQLQAGTDPGTGNPYDRAGSIKKIMQDVTPTLDLNNATITFSNITKGTSDAGGPGDIIRVNVSYDWNIITPLIRPFFSGGKITLRVSSTMKNETYS